MQLYLYYIYVNKYSYIYKINITVKWNNSMKYYKYLNILNNKYFKHIKYLKCNYILIS